MTIHHLGKETAMTVEHHLGMGAATRPAQESEPSTTQALPPPQRVGDPRALLAARLLAAAALIVTAFIHGKLAMQFGVGGQLLSHGQLFAAQATISAIHSGALLTRNNRVWLVAVVLSLSGLVGVLVSVYLPLPALGPLPAIDEQVWFMTKIVAAFAQASVPALWLIRQIAPSSPPQ